MLFLVITAQPKPSVQSIYLLLPKARLLKLYSFWTQGLLSNWKKVQFRTTFKEKHTIAVISKCYISLPNLALFLSFYFKRDLVPLPLKALEKEKPYHCSAHTLMPALIYQHERAFCAFFRTQGSKLPMPSFHEKELLHGFIVSKIHWFSKATSR